jgi:hypothetical protein
MPAPDRPAPDAPNSAVALRHLIMDFRLTQLIHVATKLGLAGQMRRQPSARLTEPAE